MIEISPKDMNRSKDVPGPLLQRPNDEQEPDLKEMEMKEISLDTPTGVIEKISLSDLSKGKLGDQALKVSGGAAPKKSAKSVSMKSLK